MTLSQLYDERLQNYIETLTSATLQGEADVEVLAATYNIPSMKRKNWRRSCVSWMRCSPKWSLRWRFGNSFMLNWWANLARGCSLRWHRLPARVRIGGNGCPLDRHVNFGAAAVCAPIARHGGNVAPYFARCF
jgi:hypothetical protein